jgi:hypothetical protein
MVQSSTSFMYLSALVRSSDALDSAVDAEEENKRIWQERGKHWVP